MEKKEIIDSFNSFMRRPELRDVAKELDVTPEYLSRVIHYKTVPSMDLIVKVEKWLKDQKPFLDECFEFAENMNLYFHKSSETENLIYGFDRHQLKQFIEMCQSKVK